MKVRSSPFNLIVYKLIKLRPPTNQFFSKTLSQKCPRFPPVELSLDCRGGKGVMEEKGFNGHTACSVY